MLDSFEVVEAIIKQSQYVKQMLGHANPQLLIYGSVANALCQEHDSDLDLTLVIDDFEMSHEVIIRELIKDIRKSERFDCPEEPMCISSGILLSFTDLHSQIEVDLSINKVLEIKNSELITAYAAFDERFLKLALFIKIWNKQHFPDKMQRLNSFSIYLMLIAFLQSRGILLNL